MKTPRALGRTRAAPAPQVGDQYVATPDAIPGVGPFTKLTVSSVNAGGTVNVTERDTVPGQVTMHPLVDPATLHPLG